jgi:hypothetical protein
MALVSSRPLSDWFCFSLSREQPPHLAMIRQPARRKIGTPKASEVHGTRHIVLKPSAYCIGQPFSPSTLKDDPRLRPRDGKLQNNLTLKGKGVQKASIWKGLSIPSAAPRRYYLLFA